MKKYKIILGLSAILSLAALSSCDKETEGVSKVTTFPSLSLKGDNTYLTKLNVAYSDPGISAIVDGKEVPVTVKLDVKGVFQSYLGTSVNTNLANKYLVNYTVLNEDGFGRQVSRTVYVANTGNLTSSIEGLYIANVTRTPSQGAVPASKDLNYVVIWKNTDGTYSISDAIGGYYSIGRAYGDAYNATGLKITATDIASNNFSFNSDVSVGTFGGALTIKSLTVDATNKQLVLSSTWASGYDFKVTLKQVNF